MKHLPQVLLATSAALALTANSAMAALPASVNSTINGIAGDVQGIFDLVFPVVALGIGLVVVIKLMKRFSSKI